MEPLASLKTWRDFAVTVPAVYTEEIECTDELSNSPPLPNPPKVGMFMRGLATLGWTRRSARAPARDKAKP